MKSAAIDFLGIISSTYRVGDVLFISIDADSQPYAADFPLGHQLRRNKSVESGGDIWRLTKNRVASRNDERLGLSSEQIALAESSARIKGQPVSDANYRAIRDKPLLMLHLINCDDKNDRLDNMAPAFGVSFPYGEFDKTVEVVVNQVWFQQMKEEFGDQDDTGVDDE